MLRNVFKSDSILTPTTEKEFKKNFQADGRDTYLTAIMLGAFYCWVIVILYQLVPEGHVAANQRQHTRILLGVMLSIPIAIRIMAVEFFTRNLTTIKLATLGSLSILLTAFALANNQETLTTVQAQRTVATIAISAWLCYTLLRVDRRLITLALAPFWGAYLYTFLKVKHDEEVLWTIWILLTIALIGWFANKRIEDRERVVFKQRKELEKQLEQIKTLMSDTQKTNAGIRHDVRQPVWAMGIYLAALQDDFENPKKQSEVKEYVMRLFQCLQSIDQTVARIAANKSSMPLINTSVATASKKEAVSSKLHEPVDNKQHPKIDPELKQESDLDDDELEDSDSSLLAEVSLEQVISKLDAIFSAVAKARNVKLKFIVNEAPTVISNEAILQDTLANLISNAIKFAAPVSRPAWVVVHCHVSRNEVRFAIADNGIGIAKDQQQKIFEPYYQISEQGSENTEHPSSEGLGLAMVQRNIAQLADHRLTLYSNPNKGTCFKMYVPRA